MPELDLSQPLPDRAHDAIRAAVVQAIADGGDSSYLTDVIFELLDGLLTSVDQLRSDVDALTPPAP